MERRMRALLPTGYPGAWPGAALTSDGAGIIWVLPSLHTTTYYCSGGVLPLAAMVSLKTR